MFTIPTGLKIFVATKALDMRKSFEGMGALVTQSLKKDIFAGHLYVFSNKRGDRIKIFYWDRNGYCFWYKRLEKGVFRFPRVHDSSYCISSTELSFILEGIDLTSRQRLRAL